MFVTVVFLVGAAGVVQSALAAPVITVTPSSFGSGQTVTVAGTGFAADQVVNVWFDGNGNTVQDAGEPSDSRTADGLGVFSGASFVAKGYEGGYFVRAGTPADNAFSSVHIGSCWFQDCFINGQDTICLLGNSPSDPLFNLGLINFTDCKVLDTSYTDASGGFALNNTGPRFGGAAVLAAAVNDMGLPGTGCVAMTVAIALAEGYGEVVPNKINFDPSHLGLLNIACGFPFPIELGSYITVQSAFHPGDPALADARIIFGAVTAFVATAGGPVSPLAAAAQQVMASAAVSGAIACGHVDYWCDGLDITFTILLNDTLQAKRLPLPVPVIGAKRWGDIIGWAMPLCHDNTLPPKDAKGNYLTGSCETPPHAAEVPGSAGPNNVSASIQCATGTVTGMSIGYDGDISFDVNDGPTYSPTAIDPLTQLPYPPGTLVDPLSPGPGVAPFTNYHNFLPGPGGSAAPGGIDVEIPRFDMARFLPQIIAMRTGKRVTVCGRFVADMHQLWNELHPVISIVLLADPQTPPAVWPLVSGTLGTNGWFTRDVTVSWDLSGSDPAVTSSAGCGTTTITTDTPGQTLTCTATSDGGTTPQSVTIKRDATAPTIGHGVSPPLGGTNGWYVSAPTVTFSCSDTGSGVASCRANGDSSGSATLGEDANPQTVTGQATDNAGNVSSDSASLQVDLSNPTISASVDRPANTNGWYNASVTVHFTCADAISGVGYCPPDKTLLEGGNQSASGTVIDVAGRQASTTLTHINIDTTPPLLAPSISPNPLYLNTNGASASPNASDPGGSGISASSCDPIDTSTAGDHTVTCQATDNAGNSSNATIHYIVGYRILGFFSPIPGSKWKTGQTVPIKIALADANNVRIPDAAAAGLLSPTCRVKFSATGAQTQTPACMKYDAATHQFIFNWKLGNTTGAATITVTISYPSTTTTTTKTESITITT